jgi:hypothetical protein
MEDVRTLWRWLSSPVTVMSLNHKRGWAAQKSEALIVSNRNAKMVKQARRLILERLKKALGLVRMIRCDAKVSISIGTSILPCLC